MFVELGNSQPIEGYRERDSEEVQYRPVDGDQITHFHFPEELTVKEAFDAVVNTLDRHFAEGSKPVWVHSDSPGLQGLLEEQFKVKKQKPAKWGNYKANETPGVVLSGTAEKDGK